MWVTAAALSLSEQEYRILQRLERSPSTPQGIALRVRIVLLAAEGVGNHAIAKKLSTSRPTVLLWRGRFVTKGSAGLLQIEEGRGRKKEISKEKIEAIIHDTLHTIPTDATQWSTRTLAKKHHVSHDFIKKIWHANGLKPHLIKTFKLSNDPHFVGGCLTNAPYGATMLKIVIFRNKCRKISRIICRSRVNGNVIRGQ